MPAISFGTGTSFFNRGDEVAAVIGKAYQAGFRSFDCATIYGTEEGLGRGLTSLEAARENLFVTTKTPDWAWTQDQIEEEVRLSLKKLNLEYLDLVLLHSPAPRVHSKLISKMLTPDRLAVLPDPENADQMDAARLCAWQGLQDCVSKGLVRDIGVSNFTVNHLEKLLKNSSVRIVPAVNQVEFNPYLVDRPLYDYCKDKGILVQAFAPLGNGKEMLADPVLKELSEKYGKTEAQIALRWAWQMGIGTVTKTEKEERMKENLDYFDFCLDQQETERINGLNKNLRLFGNPAQFP